MNFKGEKKRYSQCFIKLSGLQSHVHLRVVKAKKVGRVGARKPKTVADTKYIEKSQSSMSALRKLSPVGHIAQSVSSVKKETLLRTRPQSAGPFQRGSRCSNRKHANIGKDLYTSIYKISRRPHSAAPRCHTFSLSLAYGVVQHLYPHINFQFHSS